MSTLHGFQATRERLAAAIRRLSDYLECHGQEGLQASAKSEAWFLGGFAPRALKVSTADSPSKVSLPTSGQRSFCRDCLCQQAFASPALLAFSPMTLPVPWSAPVDLPLRDVLSPLLFPGLPAAPLLPDLP